MESPSLIRSYKVIDDKDNTNNRSDDWHLEPYHTHFVFFDDRNDGTNNVQNVLSKRQEIEHQLSISKVLKQPVAGYKPQNPSMSCQY